MLRGSVRAMNRNDLARLRDEAAAAAEHFPPAAASMARAAAELFERARQLAAGEATDLSAALAQLPPSALAALLEERRRAAGLNLSDMARRTRLSLNTLRDIVKGRRTPAPQTLTRLVALRELGLSEQAPSSQPDGPNSHIMLRYDRRSLIEDMRLTLNSASGQLEQTCLYLDDASAEDWISLSNAPGYVEANRALPLGTIAAAAVATAGRSLDVIALGPGDGQGEVALCKELLAAAPGADLHLFLVDISHTLLTVAHQRARSSLEAHGVRVESVHGDFHQLARYARLAPKPGSLRRRLYVLLGGTIANLTSELQFVRNSLAPALPGDLMLLDCVLGYGNPDDADELRKRDPVLTHPISPLIARWLGGVVQRYCRDLESYQLGAELQIGGSVPGSYEIVFHADVLRQGGQRQRYYLGRARRYDRAKLVAALGQLGWTAVRSEIYGPGGRCAVELLRKE